MKRFYHLPPRAIGTGYNEIELNLRAIASFLRTNPTEDELRDAADKVQAFASEVQRVREASHG